MDRDRRDDRHRDRDRDRDRGRDRYDADRNRSDSRRERDERDYRDRDRRDRRDDCDLDRDRRGRGDCERRETPPPPAAKKVEAMPIDHAAVDVDAENQMLAQMMGMRGFGTSKTKKVEGNEKGAIKKKSTIEFRQVLNVKKARAGVRRE
eukprot:TRINITY_DN28454_c0_g1_i1.p1 TRINITY_DN28454_c0_g1~~TRINITY_DN28454_c0_g1_i1.p1  ORF type:complete len:149 (+),score=36.32 TRINITY_DN28454_c0_g1_i1:70-516(+)